MVASRTLRLKVKPTKASRTLRLKVKPIKASRRTMRFIKMITSTAKLKSMSLLITTLPTCEKEMESLRRSLSVHLIVKTTMSSAKRPEKALEDLEASS